MFLRPYFAGFRLALSQELVHRVNFLIGKVRDFIFFAALILLFSKLPHGIGRWGQEGLLTYAILSAFLSTQITAQAMNAIASEITDGDLTNFLLRPMNYLGYWTARVMAIRVLAAVGGIVSVAILLVLFPNIHLALPHDVRSWLAAGTLFLGSLILMQLIDFIAGLLSFWTDRAYGPRFLALIMVQFLSGAYLPIDTLPSWTQTVLRATPFPSLIFAPIATLIDGPGAGTVDLVRTQVVWIAILGMVLAVVWKRGIRTYEAYGR